MLDVKFNKNQDGKNTTSKIREEQVRKWNYLENYKLEENYDIKNIYKDADAVRKDKEETSVILEDVDLALTNLNDKPEDLVQCLKDHKDDIFNLFAYYFKISLCELQNIQDEEMKQEITNADNELNTRINNIEITIATKIGKIPKKRRKSMINQIPEFKALANEVEEFNYKQTIDEISSRIVLYLLYYEELTKNYCNLMNASKLPIPMLEAEMNSSLQLCTAMAKLKGCKNKIELEQLHGIDFDFIYRMARVAEESFINSIKFWDFRANFELSQVETIMCVRKCLSRTFGKEYVKIFDKAFEEKRVLKTNAAPNVVAAKDIALLMTNDFHVFRDQIDLAHEFGHLIEHELRYKNQVRLNNTYNALSELPSLVNELLITDFMKDNIVKLSFDNPKFYDYAELNVQLETFQNFANMIFNNAYAVEYEKYLIKNNRDFNYNYEMFNEIWNDKILANVNPIIRDKVRIEFDYKNLTQQDFKGARYIYGSIFAIIVFQKIKQDKEYAKIFMDFQRQRDTMSVEESLKFLQIDFNNKEKIIDSVEKYFVESMRNMDKVCKRL